MIVTYNPKTMLPDATVEEPLPPGMVELYEELAETKGLCWFEAPDGVIFNMMVVKAQDGSLSLEPQTPTPGELSATTASIDAEITLAGLPDPVSLSVDGEPPQAVTGGQVAFSFSEAGSYALSWWADPFTPASATVVVS